MTEQPPPGNPAGEEPRPSEGADEELASLHRRMDEIRQELAEEVDSKWSSTWRSPEMFEVKVSARLSAHEEYQALLSQARKREEGPVEPRARPGAGGSGSDG